MRATMFGHDIHRLDLEAALAVLDSQISPAPSPVAAPPAQTPSPRPRYEPPRQEAEPIPEVAAPMPEYLRRQSNRPHGSGSFRASSLDNTDTPQAPRVPLMARLVLVAGVAALTVAALLSIQSGSSPIPTEVPSNIAPPPSLPAPPIGTARTTSPVEGDPTETLPIAPGKSVKSTPAPAPTVAPKTARPAPPVVRPAPRRKPPAPEAEASDSEGLASPPPAAEAVASPIGPPPEGKDVSPPEQTAQVERKAPVRKRADGAGQQSSARARSRDVDATMPPSIE